MYLTDLADACRKSGLTVVELDGWRTRGRPASTGDFNPRGVLVHHTGGKSDSREYAAWMATVGRSDLPAPLCHLALDRQGTVYVCAAGRANHGGTAKACGPMPAGDANELYIGIEAMNDGSEGWDKPQYEAYVRLCAALCLHYDWHATHVRAHRETSVTGKWDPGRLDMPQFRTDIAARIAEEQDNMPNRSEFQEWVRETPITVKLGADDTPTSVPLRRVLANLEQTQDQTARDIREIQRALTRIEKALAPPDPQ